MPLVTKSKREANKQKRAEDAKRWKGMSGAELLALRVASKMTQEEAAKALGYNDRSMIALMEGNFRTINTRVALAARAVLGPADE